MSIHLKNILKIASIYISTVIGAGFVSGQEIMQFFSVYNSKSFYGLVLSGILFGIVGFIVLNKIYMDGIQSYKEFICIMLGKKLGNIMDIIITLFTFCFFSIMVAGSSRILFEKIHIVPLHGSILVVIISSIFVVLGIERILKMSIIITPILIFSIIIIGTYIIIFKSCPSFLAVNQETSIMNNWITSSILYVGYNIIIPIPIMCSLLPYLTTKKVASLGGIIGGIGLSFIAIIINILVSKFYPEILTADLPIIHIINKYNNALGTYYTIVLLMAMFISAVTSANCFADRIQDKLRISRLSICIIAGIIIIPLSQVGFSALISTIYPLFGIIGLIMIVLLIVPYVSKKIHLLF